MKLFPRNPGCSRDADAINKAKAHRMLDLLKAGEFIPEHRIVWALRILGDME